MTNNEMKSALLSIKAPTCRDLIAAHIGRMPHNDGDHWAKQHCNAYYSPRPGVEQAFLSLITAFATLADAHAALTDGEIRLGDDGYYRKYAKDLVKAMLAYLDFDIGRFDAGTLYRLIRDLATAAGELEP